MAKPDIFTFHHKLDGQSLHHYYDGNLAYASDMFSIFIQRGPAEAHKLRQLLDAQDWDGLSFHLHKLGPAFAMVGLSKLAEKSGQLKKLVSEDADARRAGAMVHELLSELQAQLPLIRQELARMQKVLTN